MCFKEGQVSEHLNLGRAADFSCDSGAAPRLGQCGVCKDPEQVCDGGSDLPGCGAVQLGSEPAPAGTCSSLNARAESTVIQRSSPDPLPLPYPEILHWCAAF